MKPSFRPQDVETPCSVSRHESSWSRHASSLPHHYIVGVGGSAGGLDAYGRFLDALPSSTGMAFVFVSHMPPTCTSHLADILSARTTMPVLVASTAMRIEANHVYVCPPNADLFIKGDAFKVVTPRSRGNVQVDIFFTSLAQAMGQRAIGIIFSGFDGDGAKGCKAIRANGGINFVQDKSAEVMDMPLSAQATGCVDFILSPEEIAGQLKQISKSSRNYIVDINMTNASGQKPVEEHLDGDGD